LRRLLLHYSHYLLEEIVFLAFARAGEHQDRLGKRLTPGLACCHLGGIRRGVEHLAQARYNVLLGDLRLRQASGTLTAEALQQVNGLLAR